MKFISKFFKNNTPIINVIRMNGVIASGSKFPGSSNLSLESLEKQIERAFSGKKKAHRTTSSVRLCFLLDYLRVARTSFFDYSRCIFA